MAHTTKIGRFVFIHDGGHDGDVTVRTGNDTVGSPFQSLTVPMVVLVEFVGGTVRDRMIAGLEQATGADVLNQLLNPIRGPVPILFDPPRKST